MGLRVQRVRKKEERWSKGPAVDGWSDRLTVLLYVVGDP